MRINLQIPNEFVYSQNFFRGLKKQFFEITIIFFQIPRRRRSRILETLREYEEEAEKASPEMPGSPCSSEELNTPLLKRIAKKLFKVLKQVSNLYSFPSLNTQSCIKGLLLVYDFCKESGQLWATFERGFSMFSRGQEIFILF